MILENLNNIYFIVDFFAHFKKSIVNNLVELPIDKTLNLKFSCSSGNEWVLICNKINVNCIPMNQ